MADWTSSMEQTFEYYTVDPTSWKERGRIDTVLDCSISHDFESDQLSTATFTITEALDECYIRPYLVVIQNGIKERFCLGTYLAQRTSSSFNGAYPEIEFEAYSPLQELDEKLPALGSYIPKGENILEQAYLRMGENMRAPIVRPSATAKLTDDFIAEDNDSELTFCRDLVAQAGYHLELDETGQVLFAPDTLLASMQPVWTYTDDNASIMQADISDTKDLYNIPNVVEVIYSGTSRVLTGIARNTDENSIVGIPRRGREVIKRITDPSFSGEPTAAMVQSFAEQKLEELSTLTCELNYKHAYNGVRIGDCVRMNYTAAGLTDIKARVTAQSFDCENSMQVSETAEYIVYF